MEGELTREEAIKVVECIKSDGWRVIRDKILEPMVNRLNTVKGLSTLRELNAQQKCLKFAEEFLNTTDDIVTQESPSITAEDIDRMTDGIIRMAKN